MATGDCGRKLVTETSYNSKIVAYGDVSWPFEGTVIIRVRRHRDSHLIKVNLVKVQSLIIRQGSVIGPLILSRQYKCKQTQCGQHGYDNNTPTWE